MERIIFWKKQYPVFPCVNWNTGPHILLLRLLERPVRIFLRSSARLDYRYQPEQRGTGKFQGSIVTGPDLDIGHSVGRDRARRSRRISQIGHYRATAGALPTHLGEAPHYRYPAGARTTVWCIPDGDRGAGKNGDRDRREHGDCFLPDRTLYGPGPGRIIIRHKHRLDTVHTGEPFLSHSNSCCTVKRPVGELAATITIPYGSGRAHPNPEISRRTGSCSLRDRDRGGSPAERPGIVRFTGVLLEYAQLIP
jgi:hypothetical protein